MTCRTCAGRGEIEAGTQPEHTRHPNPAWEPWEPDVTTCPTCGGSGEEAA